MTTLKGRRRTWVAPSLVLAWTLLVPSSSAFALNRTLQINQYGHTAWTVRDGFSLGAVFAMAQTPDGYLWLGSDFGLFHFDGVRFVRWEPPTGERPIRSVYSLLSARDGTLWVGTFEGLASWRDGRLTRFPELDGTFVTAMFEAGDGTLWVAGIDWDGGRLCAVRDGRGTCSGNDGRFGAFVWSIHEDKTGTLWLGADTGVWRWRPGPPVRFSMPGLRVGDLTASDGGGLLIGIRGKALRQLVGEQIQQYPIRGGITPTELPDRDVDSNKLLRDRDGALWIGTEQRGLLHVQDGRADSFAKSDGLSGDIICSLFEDREGNIWVATVGGLDRFRELPVVSYSTKQGLSSDAIGAVVASRDGSVWLGTQHDGLMRWTNGQTATFHRSSGLPDDDVQSLFEDSRGRLWVFTAGGLARADGDRFVAVPGVPSQEVFSITGDDAGNLWLSGNRGLTHLLAERVVEHFPWSTLGRHQQAKVVRADHGGVWLSFWTDGGVVYFKDGRLMTSYGAAEGLGSGHVPGLELDGDGAIWASTEEGGISRIKDGRVMTLTTRNGLPCDTIHATILDESRALWVYAACGMFRIARAELDAWILHPTVRVGAALWDAADGVNLGASARSSWGPTMARSTDGKVWFLSGEGMQVADPRHLVANGIPPPVRIEQITANGQTYDGVQGLRLPALVRDLRVDFTALSLAAPQKVRFRYRLEGHDPEWQDAGNRRQAFYTNLSPRTYRFRVSAANNSGVWNEAGAVVDFSIAPAIYQTNWFRALGAALLAAMLWAAWQLRLRQLGHQLEMTLDARVAERTRIARDLHDTLLQDFQGVLLLFDRSLRLLPEQPQQARQRLETALQQAVRATTVARNAIQGLRLSADDDDLVRSIGAIRDEFAGNETHDTPLAIAVDGTARPLKPLVGSEVYRIADEAVRNAYRHAAARQITLEIGFDARQFRLRVRDDGKGIDHAAVASRAAGHFGLQGMRERAELLGGRLEVWSKNGSGTQIQLTVPAAAAYADSPPERPLWQRLFRQRDASVLKS